MLSNRTNRQIKVKSRPVGKPKESDFELVDAPLPEIGNGQFLARTLWISVDPYMVGRLRAEANYVQGVGPGDVMCCFSVAQIVESQHPGFRPGEMVHGYFGMSEYVALRGDAAEQISKIDPALAPPQAYLGILGLTGLTAYFGLLDLGTPKAGETVVVSAGAGAVGSAVGRIAKIKGCRAVAIVGSDEKCRHAVEDLGFDAAVNYKSATPLTEQLRAACPKGIDVYFDNTGGPISDALLPLYNTFARIVICGRIAIAHLTDTNQDIGLRDHSVILVKRLRKFGLIVFDYADRYPEGIRTLAQWMRDGLMPYREDVLDGIANAPRAFIRLLDGANIGKQLVRVADPE